MPASDRVDVGSQYPRRPWARRTSVCLCIFAPVGAGRRCHHFSSRLTPDFCLPASCHAHIFFYQHQSGCCRCLAVFWRTSDCFHTCILDSFPLSSHKVIPRTGMIRATAFARSYHIARALFSAMLHGDYNAPSDQWTLQATLPLLYSFRVLPPPEPRTFCFSSLCQGHRSSNPFQIPPLMVLHRIFCT